MSRDFIILSKILNGGLLRADRALPVTIDDGGRKAAGFKGIARDCAARAIAIAAQLPYAEVHARLSRETGAQRRTRRVKSRMKATADHGILAHRKWFDDYMRELGFEWVPTMTIGSGCRVHLAAGELPMGRLVVNVSRHLVAVIDGVVRDTHDCTRGGTRCVYGYYRKI